MPEEKDPLPPPMRLADLFVSMADPAELAAGMVYLRDVSTLTKARAKRSNKDGLNDEDQDKKRFKKPGKGEGKGDS